MPDAGKGPQAPKAEAQPQGTQTRLAKIVGRYASAFDTWLARYQRAVGESRNGTYSTEKWMSDVSAFWGDAASLMAFPLAIIDPATFSTESAAAASAVSLEVDGSADELIETIMIADPGAGAAVEVNKLTTDNGDFIPPENVKVDLSANRRSVVVRLVGLKNLLGDGLVKGTYGGRITLKEQEAPLALLNVVVK